MTKIDEGGRRGEEGCCGLGTPARGDAVGLSGQMRRRLWKQIDGAELRHGQSCRFSFLYFSSLFWS